MSGMIAPQVGVAPSSSLAAGDTFPTTIKTGATEPFQTPPGNQPVGAAPGGSRGSEFALNFGPPGNVLDASTSPSPDEVELPMLLANDTVIVQTLTWYVDRGRDMSGRLQELGNVPASSHTGQFFANPQSGIDRKVKFNVQSLSEKHMDDFGQPMVLGVDWSINGRSGKTFSPAFAIVQSTADIAAAQANLQQTSFRAGNETTDDSSSSGSPKGSTPAAPTSGNGGGNGTAGINTVSASHSGGGGGLSTGAIIGIAVGVGVAALLAAALGLFFFLRRRKSRSAALDQTRAEQEKLSGFPKGGGHGNASDAAMAPYHDGAAGGGAAGTRGLEDEDTPLDQPCVRSENGSRATTPHGVSRHLVEDGMTQDEIRRLEEEEAHLDNEIQRAGGRR